MKKSIDNYSGLCYNKTIKGEEIETMMNLMTVARRCPFCQKVTSIAVDPIAYMMWERGACVQDALPMLSVAEREVIISGLCVSCQDDFFDDEDDE